MPCNTFTHLEKRHDLLVKSIEQILKRIALSPDGNITVKHKSKRFYYYQNKSNNESEYINKNDTSRIRPLVQKRYLQHALRMAQNELAVLDKALKNYPLQVIEDAYDTLGNELKQYATPIVMSDEQYVQKWIAAPYPKKPIKDTSKVFITLKDERVRSKSEVIIADRLFAKGIPYKYECPVQVEGEVIHPDFKILKLSTRKDVYLEHCGMMDDPDYTTEVVRRSNKLAKAGIIQGYNLFYTFETADMPLDLDILDELIEKNFR